MTQQEAASRAGFKGDNARARWSDIECGRKANPSIDTVGSVARALDCTIDELMK